MSMPTVVVIGTATVDFLAVNLPSLPGGVGDQFDDQTLVSLPHPPQLTIGGNGGNTSYVLGRLGINTRLISPLGDDRLGRIVVDWLEEAGVTFERIRPSVTSTNYVATTVDGDRRSYFFPVEPNRDDLIRLAGTVRLDPGDHLHIAGYPHPAMEAIRIWLDTAGDEVTTSLDIGPGLAGIHLSDLEDLLPGLTWLFGNEIEIAGPTGDLESATAETCSKVGAGVVVKRGPDGATVVTRHDRFEVPAQPVDATATVGAGDAFDAGFIAALVQGRPVRESAKFATVVAGMVLERGGGVLAAPAMSEIPTSRLETTDIERSRPQ